MARLPRRATIASRRRRACALCAARALSARVWCTPASPRCLTARWAAPCRRRHPRTHTQGHAETSQPSVHFCCTCTAYRVSIALLTGLRWIWLFSPTVASPRFSLTLRFLRKSLQSKITLFGESATNSDLEQHPRMFSRISYFEVRNITFYRCFENSKSIQLPIP